MTTPALPPDLRMRVLAAASAERVAPRSVGLWQRALAVVAGVAVSVGILFAIGGPGDYGRPTGYYPTLAVLWLAVGLGAAWAGVARGRSMLGRPATWGLLAAVLTPVALMVTAAMAGLAWPSVLGDVAKMRHHVVCIEFTTLMALGPLAAFAFLRRGSDPVAPRITGAAIGAVAGAIGALGIETRCRHASLFHVAFGHLLPVVALTLVGALVVGPIVAVRARRG
jgi:hypothetical protein